MPIFRRTQAIPFKGSVEQAMALNDAIRNNCACGPGVRCGAHASLLEPGYVDRLLFMRWMAQQKRVVDDPQNLRK